MKNFAPIIFLLFLFAIICCEPKEAHHYFSWSIDKNYKTDSLRYKGEVFIELDSFTYFYTPHLIHEENDSAETISFLNLPAQRIDLYDLKSSRLLNTIDYDLEGIDGVGINPGGFLIHTFDSIFILDKRSGQVSLINHKGKLIDKYDFIPYGINKGHAFPIANTQSPIFFDYPNLMLTGALLPWPDYEVEERVFLSFNVERKELKYQMKRPSFNTPHTWGDGLMHYINYDYNSENGKFIFSFNNYKSIVEADFEQNIFNHYETQSDFVDSIKPYSYKQFDKMTKADLEKYYYRNSRFWSVIYDKYRNCYYRLVLSPIELMKYEQGVRNMKVSILVLNNKFEKLGEVLVDNVSYNLNTMFVNEQGINILSRTKYRENPSRFTFDIFEPIIEKR